MPKVKGPLFSVSASGTYRDALEFRTQGAQTTVAAPRRMAAPRSPAQQDQAARFALAIQGWREATPILKDAWKSAAAPLGLTGYQYYLSEYANQGVQPPGQPIIP